jgi:hypothetical protein
MRDNRDLRVASAKERRVHGVSVCAKSSAIFCFAWPGVKEGTVESKAPSLGSVVSQSGRKYILCETFRHIFYPIKF